MSEREYDALQKGEKIRILHPLDFGRVTTSYDKAMVDGVKCFRVNHMLYKMNDVEICKEG